METKLRRQIIAAFGITFVLIVAIIVTWKLKFYDVVNAELATANTAYSTNKATADQLPEALRQQAIARENLLLAQNELNSFRQRFRALRFDNRTPAKLKTTFRGYLNEYSSGYGVAVRDELVKAADDAGVSINTSIKIDAPPQMPENVVFPTSGFLKPSGGALTITAVGSLPDIMSFLDRVNKSPILATVGAITLNGASPEITASFTVTPYLLAIGPSIQLSGGASTAVPGDPTAAAAPGTTPPGAAPGAAPGGGVT